MAAEWNPTAEAGITEKAAVIMMMTIMIIILPAQNATMKMTIMMNQAIRAEGTGEKEEDNLPIFFGRFHILFSTIPLIGGLCIKAGKISYYNNKFFLPKRGISFTIAIRPVHPLPNRFLYRSSISRLPCTYPAQGLTI
jgi:hypothetical protein